MCEARRRAAVPRCRSFAARSARARVPKSARPSRNPPPRLRPIVSFAFFPPSGLHGRLRGQDVEGEPSPSFLFSLSADSCRRDPPHRDRAPPLACGRAILLWLRATVPSPPVYPYGTPQPACYTRHTLLRGRRHPLPDG